MSKHVNIPSRYLQYEHSSQQDTDSIGSYPSKKDYKSSANSLSQHSGEAVQSHMQPMLPLPEGYKKRATIGTTRFRGQMNQPKQMKRSNSDDSLYESSTLERRKKQGLSGTPYKAKQCICVCVSACAKTGQNWHINQYLLTPHRFCAMTC